MVRLLETFWRGSLQWWVVEDITTGTRYEVHTYQLDDETFNEMEAIAWAAAVEG